MSEIHSSNEEFKTDMSAIRTEMPELQNGIDNIQLGQDKQKLHKLLEWISPTNFASQQSDFIAGKQTGTCQWFLDSPEFNKWLTGRGETLFCPGIPGAGKTMISAVAIDHLHRTIHNNRIGVAYVFCNYKMQPDQNTTSLLSAILKQLVQLQPSAAEAANALYKTHDSKGTKATVDEITGALKTTLKSFSTTFIVVDALDECSDERGTPLQLLAELRDLQIEGDLRLMATSRFIPDIVEEFKSTSRLEVRANPEDVAKFVKGQIPRLPRCIRCDRELQGQVEEKIVKAVDGMLVFFTLLQSTTVLQIF